MVGEEAPSLMSVAPPMSSPMAPPPDAGPPPPVVPGLPPGARTGKAPAQPVGPGPMQPPPMPAEGIGQARTANAALDTWYADQTAKLVAKQGTGGGVRVAAKPEKEQRTGVQRQRSEGYAPGTQRELEQLESGPPPLEQQVAPGPRYSAREMLALTDPPATAKTPAQKQTWAQGLADDLTAKGISLSQAQAMGVFAPRAVPKPLAKIGGGAVDQWRADEEEERGALITALDNRSKQAVEQTSMANQAKRAESEKWAERYGAGGMQGIARAGAAADKRVADAMLGTRETEKAEEGAGQMVRDAEGNWVFEQSQDREVWRPGAIEQNGQADAQFQEQRSKLLEAQQAKIDSIMGDIDRTASEAAGKVDPLNFFANKSTVDKIGIAIAQAMGAFASGINGGPNHAANIINGAIERDIAAQVTNLQEKRGKLNDLQQLYKRVVDDTGSKVLAADAARMALHARVDTMLAEAQAQAGSEKAGLKAQELANVRQQQLVRERAQLEERTRGTVAETSKVIPGQDAYVTGPIDNTRKIEELLHKRVQLGEGAAKLDLATGGAMADAMKAQAAAQGKERPVVTWEGQDIRVRPGVPESVVAKAYDSTAAGATLLSSLKALEEQQKKMGANTLSRQEARMIVRNLVGAPLNQLVGGGAMSNDEASAMIDNLTDSAAGGNAAAARQQVATMVRTRVQDQIKAIQAR
jgi:hypothetical protein